MRIIKLLSFLKLLFFFLKLLFLKKKKTHEFLKRGLMPSLSVFPMPCTALDSCEKLHKYISDEQDFQAFIIVCISLLAVLQQNFLSEN